MVFTTVFFTFIFFPFSLIVWFLSKIIDTKITKTRISDVILILLSLIFFCASNFQMWSWLLIYIGTVYIFGLLLEQAAINNNHRIVKRTLICGIAILIVLLGYYKYFNLTIELLNRFFHTSVALQNMISPLGISFITFTAISYLVDIAMKKSAAGNIIDCALYISFFPKIISGPIVLWKDFSSQIKEREISLDLMTSGINRICVGFAKKVILADTFGKQINLIDSSYATSGVDSITAFSAVILYWLQIYYDFSGYSDIAIGLSKVFGFTFTDNFNFPYLSKSISEFWRRWHISLGTWFREYVYFPLGGSRYGMLHTIINLGIVFLLTGVWHGTGINYILWGGY